MCGIAGVFDPAGRYPVREELLVDMVNTMHHRGPDELSSYVDGCVGFGFRRLSIVDLLNGHQPFFNEDRSIALICNGEIYNHWELREDLEKKGYKFKTSCDIEVLISLYEEYKTGFLERLNGQFAMALFDKRENTLLLARDQFGICPLFYTSSEGLFIFGSEIKAIIRHPDVRREVNLEGLDQIFTFPGMVSPITLFKNIFSLAPGHYMIVKDGSMNIRQYWDLDYPIMPEETVKPESYYADRLEDLLLRSVNYRLMGDVPVGFYLSGGLDSSLIGSLMKAINPESHYPAFSVGFPVDQEMNERDHQRRMVEHLKVSGHEIMFDGPEVEKRLKAAIWAAESALKESYNTCSLALSESVRRNGIKVVLSGEGADELFGGYVGYRFDKQRSRQTGIKDPEDQLEDECRIKLWGDPDFFYEKNYYEFSDVKKALYSDQVRRRFHCFNSMESLAFNKNRIRDRHILHKRSYVDLKLRLSDHLISDHCDRVTYANSVEGRFPFLDINLVEFVRTIPPDLKLKGLTEKYILKKIAEKYMPESIVNRQKFGFIAPGSSSLLKQNIEWINDLLSYSRIKRQGYFDPDMVEFLKKRYGADNFKLNLPFESDLLIVVLTFNIFLEIFGMPDLD